MGKPRINVCIVYLLLLCPLVVGYTTTHAGTLATALKAASNVNARPTGSTTVYTQLGIMSIDNMDIVTQEFTMIGFLLMSWEDSRLIWNASDYGEIKDVHLKTSEIWAPLVLLNNGGSSIEMINDNSDTASATSYISSNGKVAWLAPVVFNSQCSVNIAYYPFDRQSCSMIITLITLLGHVMSAVQFDITLERKYQFYLLNLIFPITLLALLGPFVFLLPVNSGEKNGFTLTVLLSMSVTMAYISDHIPSSALNVCILSVYLLIVFIICSLETLLTVLSCQIHSYHGKGYVPGSRLQKLISAVTKISCYGRPQVDENEVISNTKLQNEILAERQYTKENLMDKQKAWEEDNGKPKENEDSITYTYDECAFIFDRVNFVVFLVVQIILTMAFFIALQIGGANQF
ncbi:acetylcholine receptor subunit beta-like [Mya arenaria]|uniref:acetylcholine receptor subunit beta-like n=1 Tax=Mya arenaria TaxID=6604 RepID=UPI0022DFB8B4|nr:acetylcholine receptor subunit beta-like [Mya arenaria]